ncbi:MAG: alanine:cation symporter family protein [Flavobacteriaceae bacterium]|nr:alanine:cation symporter family protein [Flavobacteriaceae bacterium]
MEAFSSLLQSLIGSLEWVMLTLILGGGFFLLLQSRGYALFNLKHGWKLLFQKENDKGISRFEALSAVLASTVGLGNISGVAIAIYMGGPGVLVWMWITAALGAVIKFYSSSLAVLLREKEADGSPLGGPMYYMSIGIPRWGKPLAIWFSIAGLFGVLPAFTANQLTQTVMTVVQPNQYISLGDFYWKILLGLVFVLISGWVILGGLKKIVTVTSKLVPLMVLLYFSMGLFILLDNYSLVLPALSSIFSEAFNLHTAVTGGFWGLVLLGVRRAVFSNESGVGNAPMYHGQSETKEPIHEGLVAALGPLLDTVFVCSITGVIIIISGAYLGNDLNGISLTLEAFNRLFFGIGDKLLLLMVLVFGISTLLTYSYYGVKCLNFLTKKKWGYLYNYIYLGSIVFSAVATVDVVIGLIDLSFALMCIPNMIAIIYLSSRVKERILGLKKVA